MAEKNIVDFPYIATYKVNGKIRYVSNPRDAKTNFEFINIDILFKQNLYGQEKWCISETTVHRETFNSFRKTRGVKHIPRNKLAYL